MAGLKAVCSGAWEALALRLLPHDVGRLMLVDKELYALLGTPDCRLQFCSLLKLPSCRRCGRVCVSEFHEELHVRTFHKGDLLLEHYEVISEVLDGLEQSDFDAAQALDLVALSPGMRHRGVIVTYVGERYIKWIHSGWEWGGTQGEQRLEWLSLRDLCLTLQQRWEEEDAKRERAGILDVERGGKGRARDLVDGSHICDSRCGVGLGGIRQYHGRNDKNKVAWLELNGRHPRHWMDNAATEFIQGVEFHPAHPGAL